MNRSPETTAIELIDTILMDMLDDDQRVRVVAFLSDKYRKPELPEWEGENDGSAVRAHATKPNLGWPGGGFGHSWGGIP